MTTPQEHLLERLGFRFGINGTHAARTMMLDDMRLLLAQTPASASRTDYAQAVVVDNVLGKATKSARQLALRHLSALYSLDTANPIFRALRRIWPCEQAAQPILALAVALARDPLLRGAQHFVSTQAVGTHVQRAEIEAFLEQNYPQRFTPASLKSFAQNLAGTWTASGLLNGHRRKIRSLPTRTPESLVLLLFLGYLEGRTGQRLFSSTWTDLLGCTTEEAEALAQAASHRGLLIFMSAGGVTEVRFPGYLTADEERVREAIQGVQ